MSVPIVPGEGIIPRAAIFKLEPGLYAYRASRNGVTIGCTYPVVMLRPSAETVAREAVATVAALHNI